LNKKGNGKGINNSTDKRERWEGKKPMVTVYESVWGGKQRGAKKVAIVP